MIEDDSQDGADHVDAHRIPALVISPYAKKGAVVHTRYDFLSFIRTLEIPIGMKPLNLFDALAVPLYDVVHADAGQRRAVRRRSSPNVDLTERNTEASAERRALARSCRSTSTDRTPQRYLDRILWQYVHGEDSEPPPPGPNASGWTRSAGAAPAGPPRGGARGRRAAGDSATTINSSRSERQGANVGVLDGKSAIVTGSARGIGRATAELLAEQGAQVLINDLDGDVAEQAAGEIQGETAVFAGDLTKEGACDKLVETAVDAFGKIDIIVNNAGYTWDGPIHKMSDEQFQAMIDIHNVVPFRVLRAAAPHLREPAKKEREEGKEVFRKVVNISSISGTMGNAGQVNYSSGKAGVVGLTKTLAKEWGQFKINVNAVAFGFVETRLTAAKEEGGSIEREGQEIKLGIPEQLRAMASMIIPLGRPATPEEAAGPVFFLCSPWANYIHGQVLNVTGGQFGGMYT